MEKMLYTLSFKPGYILDFVLHDVKRNTERNVTTVHDVTFDVNTPSDVRTITTCSRYFYRFCLYWSIRMAYCFSFL